MPKCTRFPVCLCVFILLKKTDFNVILSEGPAVKEEQWWGVCHKTFNAKIGGHHFIDGNLTEKKWTPLRKKNASPRIEMCGIY